VANQREPRHDEDLPRRCGTLSHAARCDAAFAAGFPAGVSTQISSWGFFIGSSSRQQAAFSESAHSSIARHRIRPRSSELSGELTGGRGEVRVLISGRCVQYLEGEIDVPV
jgi:hypothetical protein